jgi:hypothetical protein
LLLIATCWSCTHNAGTEKHQDKRDNVVHVRDKVKEIVIEDVLIHSAALVYIMNDYLIIEDTRSKNEFIYIFDKNTFRHVTGTAYKGQGPGEITVAGHIGVDEANRRFYVSDFGKQRIFGYDLDSVLANPHHMPEEKMKMNEKQFPDRYQYINDTLCIGVIIEPVKNGVFRQIAARWNMNTGEMVPMKYEHPEIEIKRIGTAASMEHGIYIEYYYYHDLMTICSLDGELKYNIYGRRWDNQKSNRVKHYCKAVFCNDRILAAYSGGDNSNEAERYPTRFLVFDLNGDYIQTLETGYKMYDFCCDKENKRIIMALNDEIQFAYLDLEGIIK